MADDAAVLPVHRHPREVAHVLVGAGELVKQGGFAAVLVSGQTEGNGLPFRNLRSLDLHMVDAHFPGMGVGHLLGLLDHRFGLVRRMGVPQQNIGSVLFAEGELVPPHPQLQGVPHGSGFD